MKNRFRLYRRKIGGMFYVEDSQTRKQESTGTRNRAEATALLNARNEASRQPQLNLQIAKAYLAGTDSGISTRTWQDAFNAIIEYKRGTTKERWQRGARQQALRRIETAMQRMELSLLTKLPGSQRALIADGQPVILEIVVTEVTKQESQPASGSN